MVLYSVYIAFKSLYYFAMQIYPPREFSKFSGKKVHGREFFYANMSLCILVLSYEWVDGDDRGYSKITCTFVGRE